VLPALVRFALGRADRGELKSALLQAVFGGESRATLEAWTASFVPRLLQRGLFADALTALATHRRHGHHLVLLSASADLYVPTIAAALGFDEALCTGIQWDGDRLVGRLTTTNRRGTEKTRCLAALRARYPGARIEAYANAASDLEHLRLADAGTLVNGTWRARRAAARDGIVCLTWR
jgi:phosphatidylglycerophosphatase C